MRIGIIEWGKEEIKNFLALPGDEHVALLKKSYEEALPEVKVQMQEGYDIICGKKEKSYCLVVEEKNCVGLTGSEEGVNDKLHFNALLRQNDNNEGKSLTALAFAGVGWLHFLPLLSDAMSSALLIGLLRDIAENLIIYGVTVF